MSRINNKTLLIIIGVLLLSNIALLAFHFLPGRESRSRNPADYMIRELKLDSVQARSFHQLWETNKEKNKPLYDSMRSGKDNLFSYLKNEPQPDSLINAAIQRVNVYDSQLLLNNYEHFKKLRAICRPEQQVKLDSIILKMGKRRR